MMEWLSKPTATEWLKALTGVVVAFSVGSWTLLEYREAQREQVRQAVTPVAQALAGMELNCPSRTPINSEMGDSYEQCLIHFSRLPGALVTARSILTPKKKRSADWDDLWSDLNLQVTNARSFSLDWVKLLSAWSEVLDASE